MKRAENITGFVLAYKEDGQLKVLATPTIAGQVVAESIDLDNCTDADHYEACQERIALLKRVMNLKII